MSRQMESLKKPKMRTLNVVKKLQELEARSIESQIVETNKEISKLEMQLAATNSYFNRLSTSKRNEICLSKDVKSYVSNSKQKVESESFALRIRNKAKSQKEALQLQKQKLLSLRKINIKKTEKIEQKIAELVEFRSYVKSFSFN